MSVDRLRIAFSNITTEETMYTNNKNSGYVGWSKSVRAVQAEECGEFPASVLARRLRVSTAAIRDCLAPSSAHHTGKYCVLTQYYYMQEAVEIIDELREYTKNQQPSAEERREKRIESAARKLEREERALADEIDRAMQPDLRAQVGHRSRFSCVHSRREHGWFNCPGRRELPEFWGLEQFRYW